MTTIGSLRYDVVADTSKFTRGMVAARSELSAANRAFRETRSPTENLSIAMEKLDKAFAKGAVDADTYSRTVRQLKSDHAMAAGGIRGTLEQFKRMPNAVSGAIKGFVAYRTAGLAAGQISAGFTDATNIEQTALSFKAMLGSADEASKFIANLQQIDKESTFDFASTARAAQLLLGYGLTAEQVIPTLRQLGDISVGNEEKFLGLANAYGQTASMGRLMAQEKNQMINAGFNPMLEIVKRTGESMGDLTKRMADGKVSTEELALAIQDATGAGGRFDGMMKQMMSSTAGEIDMLATEYKELRREMMTAALPVARQAVGVGKFALDSIQMNETSMSSGIGEWFREHSLLWNAFAPETIGDKPSQQYTAAQLAEQKRAAEMVRMANKTQSDPEKQHKEAQDMRAKQIMATEEQTNKTQELIDAQPTPVS